MENPQQSQTRKRIDPRAAQARRFHFQVTRRDDRTARQVVAGAVAGMAESNSVNVVSKPGLLIATDHDGNPGAEHGYPAPG